MRLKQLAIVVNDVTENPEDWNKIESKLIFEKEYIDGLYRLSKSQRIWVIFGFHKRRGWQTRVRPRKATDKSTVGIFASRSVQRPNKLGLTLVRLVSVKKNVVTVKGLDAFDGSPVFDLKPYEKDYDQLK